MIPAWVLKIPWKEVKKHGSKYKLDPYLIAAIVWTESAGNQWAIRFEPKWSRFLAARDYAEKTNETVETEEVAQATSWGYMQIMGTTARQLGYKGYLSGLCDPDTNINYGTKYLKSRHDKFDSVEAAVAAYNAGTPRLTDGGMFFNQRYVDKVMGKYRVLSALKYLE